MYINKIIKIHGITDVTDFVRMANTVDGDVTCYKDRYVVNGKSIMGMMSINISDGVRVEYPIEASEFGKFIEQFVVSEDE